MCTHNLFLRQNKKIITVFLQKMVIATGFVTVEYYIGMLM